MIHDLDKTIKALLLQELQKLAIEEDNIEIAFDMPSDEWEASLTKLTINCFLYDIRENKELKSNEGYLSRNIAANGGATGTQTIAPTRIDLSYLISVWSAASNTEQSTKVEEEHRLLGYILPALLTYPTIPENLLQGEMSKQPLPLRAWVSQPERTPNTWDFWAALDGRMKAGISYMVTVAVEPFAPVEVDLVTEKVLQFQQK